MKTKKKNWHTEIPKIVCSFNVAIMYYDSMFDTQIKSWILEFLKLKKKKKNPPVICAQNKQINVYFSFVFHHVPLS